MQVFKNNVSLEATPASDTHIVNKAYLEDRISKINVQHAIKVDTLPTCADNGDGTYTISYVKDGTAETTTDTSQWFYYLDNNSNLKQTIFLDGEELTIDGAEIALDDYAEKTMVEDAISELEANFQDGVDTIYEAVVLKGQTPLDKSPQSISNAIGNITTGEGATGIFDTLTYTKMRVTSTANASLGCGNAPTGYSTKGICIMSNGVNTGNSMTFAIGENEIEQLGSYCVGASNGNSNITDIDVQELNRVETLYYFMHDSSKLKSLVFSGKVDTSKCTNMHAMFYNNPLLESLDLSKLDTSNVTTMHAMFRLCKTLASVDLSSFNTAKVTNMEGMFDSCNALKELDLSNFDVSKCTALAYMMQNCSSLTDLNISGWQFDSVAASPLVLCRADTGSRVIVGCTSLKNLIANNIGSKSATTTSMARLLDGCYAEHIELDNLNIPNVTNLGYAISSCPNLKSLSFKNLYAPKVTTLEGLLQNCTKLEDLDITGLDTSNITNINHVFNGCKSIKELDLSSWDTSKVTAWGYVFANMSVLTDLNISNWVLDSIAVNDGGNHNLGKQMAGCTALENLIANDWSTSKATNFSYRFTDCPAKNIQANNWNLESVTTMQYLFYNAKAESISIENLKIPKCTNISYTFAGCKSLKQLDLSTWDASKVTNASDMFNGCTALEELDLSNWNTTKLATRSNMFKSVPATCVIKVGSNWTLTEAQTGFAGTFTRV